MSKDSFAIEEDEIDNSMRKYREKNFCVEIEPTRHPLMKDEFTISLTQNGRQWQSFSLSPREAKIVIGKIMVYMKLLKT
jgi:phage gpG-like protein